MVNNSHQAETRARWYWGVAVLLTFSASFGACARIGELDETNQSAEDASSGEGSPSDSPSEIEYIPVDGALYFGTQCPIGSFADPEPVLSALWDCDAPTVSRFRILEPAPTVLLQADCRKRLLTVRIRELELDLTWQILPDGRFSIPVDKSPPIYFEGDSTGEGPCVALTRLTLSGTLHCEDLDHPEIQLDSVWMLNPPPLPTPSPSPSASPSATPSPGPSASPSPAPTASPSPSPSAAPSPQPSASPSSGVIALDRAVRTTNARTCRFEESCLLHAPHRLKQCR
jgi:hypothetical protein